ncbi:MAG: hypothetical protein ABI839_07720, partial [Verrucomicrobiota bacterium]
HWKSERLFRRWFPHLRSKYLLDDLIIPPAVDGATVLILISDELYRVPRKIPALAVFKQYVSDQDHSSIPFPLGVRRGFPDLHPKRIRERSIDVGFIGRMYPHRRTFLTALLNHPKLKDFRLDLLGEARLSISEYANFLNDTKISLCLAGNSSPETFRYFESTKMGCIVISPRMPANALYERHPGVQLQNANDVEEMAASLRSILEAPERQETLQGQSLLAWRSQYSPSAIASAISHKIQSGESNSRS